MSSYLTNLEDTELGAKYNYQSYRVEARNYLTKTRPNLTFFFSRTIQSYKLWYRNFSGISADNNRQEWEKLIRQAYFEFVPYALNFTTGVFMLEIPHAINEPEKCLKKIKNLHQQDWLKFATRCQESLEYDSGIEFMRKLFNLGPLIFHNQSDSFVFDSVDDGVLVWRNAGHISTKFAKKKLGVLAVEIIKQNIHLNSFTN